MIRKMYWADWGNHPKIETAAMDGTMRETLVEENIQWPTGKTHTVINKHLPIIICSMPSVTPYYFNLLFV